MFIYSLGWNKLFLKWQLFIFIPGWSERAPYPKGVGLPSEKVGFPD